MEILTFLKELHPQFDYEKSEDFFADGMLDSFDLTRLIAEMEARWHVDIAGSELDAANFRNLAAITSLLGRHGVEL